MSDLIRRLREEPKSRERLNGLSSAATVAWHDTCLEAADRIESDAAQIESLQRENENLKLQAEGWAQEARTANGTIAEIYQIVTDSTGEPGNWHGAEPVRRRIAELEATAITPEMRERDVVLGDGRTAVSSISNADEKWAGICLSAGGRGVGVPLPENVGKEDLSLNPFLRLICTSAASIDVLISELQSAKESFRDLLGEKDA